LVVGPEGGLAPEEIALLVSRGATAVTLGPRVLRTETAGLAALAALLACWGDLGAPRG
jgi:16S rRNA (uracil1498-N3)-methyltransferase